MTLPDDLTLRDWFAGQVVGVAFERATAANEREYTQYLGRDIGGATREELAAALAYKMADALMARRQRSKL